MPRPRSPTASAKATGAIIKNPLRYVNRSDPKVAMLAPKAAERLAKITHLLASDQPGEVVNTAAAATRLLSEHGWTWEILVLRPNLVPSWSTYRLASRATGWHAVAANCLAHSDLLTSWEFRFVVSLPGFKRLSPKQMSVLIRVHGAVATCVEIG